MAKSRLRIESSIFIHQSASIIFDITQDYTKRLLWDSFLIKAELINGAATAGKGIRAYCVAKYGMGMETEYVSFNRPKVTAIAMTRGPYMFKEFAGSWTFNEVSFQETEVIFIYSFLLRFPFNLMGNFIQRKLQSNVAQRLTDLKSFIEQQYPIINAE